MRIFTHVSVDLDAVCSVWAATRFIAGADKAELCFRPANWDGAEMAPGDLALDIEAGGRGIKGQKEESGTVHSCFALVMKLHASAADQAAMFSVMEFVDAQDAHGSAVEYLIPDASARVKGIFARTGLNTVLRALQSFCGNNDAMLITRMSEILDGMLRSGRARQRAVVEASKVKLVGDGKVAVSLNNREYGTNGVLFSDRGVQIVVYVDGYNLGLIRHNDLKIRMDHPEIRAVVEKAGEMSEWFAHSNGFLFCRGSRKSPATTMSKVSPMELAEAALRALSAK